MILFPIVVSTGQLPKEILQMDDDDAIELFLNALRRGKEKVYNIRVMVVGHYGVGKTTVTRRLVGESVDMSTYDSTNGVDMWKCKVSIPDGRWLPAHRGTSYLILVYHECNTYL
jgi:hypothetical protein